MEQAINRSISITLNQHWLLQSCSNSTYTCFSGSGVSSVVRGGCLIVVYQNIHATIYRLEVRYRYTGAKYRYLITIKLRSVWVLRRTPVQYTLCFTWLSFMWNWLTMFSNSCEMDSVQSSNSEFLQWHSYPDVSWIDFLQYIYYHRIAVSWYYRYRRKNSIVSRGTWWYPAPVSDWRLTELQNWGADKEQPCLCSDICQTPSLWLVNIETAHCNQNLPVGDIQYTLDCLTKQLY